MFRRLAFENSAALFTIVAFITAATIYVAFAWRALRMKRPQVAHFENLPFETETPAAVEVQTCFAPDSPANRGRSKSAPQHA